MIGLSLRVIYVSSILIFTRIEVKKIVKETHSHKHKSAKGSKSESTELSLASRKSSVIPAALLYQRLSINVNDDTIDIDLIDDIK